MGIPRLGSSAASGTTAGVSALARGPSEAGHGASALRAVGSKLRCPSQRWPRPALSWQPAPHTSSGSPVQGAQAPAVVGPGEPGQRQVGGTAGSAKPGT